MSTCKSCHAPVLFFKTTTGGWMPVERDKVAGGNIELRGEVGHVVQPDTTPRYVSHFKSCPNANGHRKPRAMR